MSDQSFCQPKHRENFSHDPPTLPASSRDCQRRFFWDASALTRRRRRPLSPRKRLSISRFFLSGDCRAVFTISGEKQTALALRRAYVSPLPDRFPRTPRPITNACSPRCSPGFAGILRDIEFVPSDGAFASRGHDGRWAQTEGDNTERNIPQDEDHARRDPRADGAQGFGQDGKVVNNFPPCRKQFIEKLRQSSIAGAERWPCSYYPDRQAGRDEFTPSDAHISTSPSKKSDDLGSTGRSERG